MKKLLLFVMFINIWNFSIQAQNTGICNIFTDDSGMNEWDPNDKVTYSVSNNELTITFTEAEFWGQNEVKWDFPSPLDFSGSATAPVTFEISVSSVTINGGTGAGCADINYLPLGISLYDGTEYSTGTATAGFWDEAYSSSTATITLSPANASAITGISIKPASFNDAGSPCNTDAGQGGTGTVTATIKIKDLTIGTANCITSTKSARQTINSVSIYPNPSTTISTVELVLTKKSKVEIVVIDVMSREVLQVAEGYYQELRKDINTNQLSKGLYAVQVIIDNVPGSVEMLLVE